MTDKAWTMRPYQEGDEKEILKLFYTVMGWELTLDRWRWLYRDNHMDQMIITLAVGNDGEVVGQCAIRPIWMKVGDEKRVAAQSLDAMVHPDYQRQGIFTDLVREAYGEAARKGMPFVYGFPNKNAHGLLARKANRIDLWQSPPIWLRVVNARSVARQRIGAGPVAAVAGWFAGAAFGMFYRLRRRGLPAGCRIERVSRFDDRLDRLWSRASHGYPVAVVRDREYLNWRYVENPTEHYELFRVERDGDLAGYAVLKEENRFGLSLGFVVDLLTIADDPALDAGLIGEAVRYFERAGIDIVGCLMLEHTPYARALRANGFIQVPARLFPQEVNCSVRPQSGDIPADFIIDPRNWYITWGDHDMV
jgi:GNAT superfamily N-acetyltransferase